MAEPQPTENPPQPSAAEQKQEAAALSNLSTNTIDETEDSSSRKAPSAADHAALGSALSSLTVGGTKTNGVSGATKKEVKKVKIDERDLKFLMDELELSKRKATEMLQASGGDRMSAIETYIVPTAKA